MKATRILASLILLAATAGAANAQFVRCSWNTCDPQVSNQNWAGPAIYKLVLSVSGAEIPNIGTDVSLFVYPDVPDAWRFDDAGCQTGSQLNLVRAAFLKTCPLLQGANPFPITFYGYDPGTKQAQLRLVNTYDTTDPSAATRYTLWQINFDHSFSCTGPTPPDLACCGGAEQPLALEVRNGQYLGADGSNNTLATAAGDVNPCTWNGGPVATQNTTLGRLKAQYR